LELAPVQEMKDFAFSTFDVCGVYADVFEWNPASIRMLEKAAYAFEGRLMKSFRKDSRTIDSMLYAIVLK
jgi:RimJ/RimL family protein N-acetyltransferase